MDNKKPKPIKGKLEIEYRWEKEEKEVSKKMKKLLGEMLE